MNSLVVAVLAVVGVVSAAQVKREAVVSYVPAVSPVVSYVAPNPVLARASRVLGEPGFVSRYVAAPVAAAPVPAVETIDARYVAAAPVASQYVAAAPVASQYVAAAPVASQYVAAAPVARQYVAAAPVASQYVAAAPFATQYVAATPVAAPAKIVSPYSTSVASSSVVNSSPSIATAPAKYSVLV